MTPEQVKHKNVVWFLNELAYLHDKTEHDNAEARRQIALIKAKR